MLDKGHGLNETTPMSQSSDNCIEHFIIGVVVAYRTIEFLTEVGNEPLGLD